MDRSRLVGLNLDSNQHCKTKWSHLLPLAKSWKKTFKMTSKAKQCAHVLRVRARMLECALSDSKMITIYIQTIISSLINIAIIKSTI